MMKYLEPSLLTPASESPEGHSSYFGGTVPVSSKCSDCCPAPIGLKSCLLIWPILY